MKTEQIKRLRKIIKRQSVNELKGFEAEWLCEKMGMDKTEYRDFQDFLIREGFLKIRYKFICPECGDVCIEYENNIKKGKCQCGTCGACYSFGDVVRIGSHLVYELLYKDLQDYDKAESEESNIVLIQIVKEKVEKRKIMGDQKKKSFSAVQKKRQIRWI